MTPFHEQARALAETLYGRSRRQWIVRVDPDVFEQMIKDAYAAYPYTQPMYGKSLALLVRGHVSFRPRQVNA